ncbi:HAMP domain-containing protein, partial [Bacillus cereus]|uniref:HAMP domain-containing protein n=1 Tax=Bacillus cereus TaxID=1396 RepID=UPI0018F71361|nr:HAMP domain-containing protein [Bacillus cereus]
RRQRQMCIRDRYDTQEGPFPFLIGVLVFIFSFFYITKRKMKQIEAMAQGVKEIERGNLAYRIEKKGEDEIAALTENINNMAEELMNNICLLYTSPSPRD